MPKRVEPIRVRSAYFPLCYSDSFLNISYMKPSFYFKKKLGEGREKKRKEDKICYKLRDIKPYTADIIDSKSIKEVIKAAREKPGIDKRC